MKNNMVMKKIIFTIAIGALFLGFESCLSCGDNQVTKSEDVTNEEVDFSSSQFESDEIKTNEPEKPSFQIVPVDLGLSVLWANANIGASSIYDIGDYYAWGEDESKSIYEMDNYFDYSVRVETGGHIIKSFNIFSKSDMSLLGTEYDTAHQLLGGKWRMPTPEEYMEMIEKCNIIKESKKMAPEDYLTYLKVQGPNGKVIILPFGGHKNGHSYYKIGGYYWTSNLYEKEKDASQAVTALLDDYVHRDFSKTNILLRGRERSLGMNVRAVMDKKTSVNTESDEAEGFVKEFYDYYLRNWNNILKVYEYVADNYLTEEYGEEYKYYFQRKPPYLDIIIETIHHIDEECPYYFLSCEYIGNNKVKVELKYYDKSKENEERYVSLSKDGSNYRIERVKAYDD